MSDLSLKIIKIDVGNKEADLERISESMLSRKNPSWFALNRLFIATSKFTMPRKIEINEKEFFSLFDWSGNIEPAIASLRLFHYIAASFGERVQNLEKEVIVISRNGKEIIPMVPELLDKYTPPIFIGIDIVSHA